MKPQYMFAFVIVTLLTGTLFSHYATVRDTDKAEAVSADTVRSVPEGTFGEASIPMTHIAGTVVVGKGEVPALKQITHLLDAQGKSKNAPVGVTWVETCHQRMVTRRAYYVPREKALVCGVGPHFIYVYQPVTRAGIEMALQRGRIAPFANANLYSLPPVTAR